MSVLIVRVQAAHGEVHRDNETLLVLMFVLKLSLKTIWMIFVVVNRKGGAGKPTVATNCGV
jgi:hypothetical protein